MRPLARSPESPLDVIETRFERLHDPMPTDRDNAATPPPPPPIHTPSVFISYAAEDRVATRALRDTLAAAGLDVWYDENELSGGDAWDQKIRRQIRDCDYFMPVISVNTEARKEGYFRREWRLATERTLDMADDVLFLLPVAIDDTPEMGARVPEKFLSVQWLRAPGGQATPAFTSLLARLHAGDHHALPRGATGPTRAPFAYHRTTAPFATPPPAAPPPLLPPAANPSPRDPTGPTPPPMPPFPHVPEKSGFFHGIKFLAEVVWWAVTAAWIVFVRLPRWARILITIWIVITLFSTRCARTIESPSPTPPRPTTTRTGDGTKKVRQAVERAAQSVREGGLTLEKADLGKVAAEIAHVFRENASDAAAAGKSLVVIPFSRPNDETPEGKFAHAVFLYLYGQLSLERRNEVAVTAPLPGEPAPAALHARATALGAGFLLTASVAAEGDNPLLKVRLFSTAENQEVWTEDFPIKGADDTAVAAKIGAQVMEKVPRKAPKRPKAP